MKTFASVAQYGLVPIFYLLFFQFSLSAQQPSFLEKYQALVDSLAAVYKIPSAVILGVAVIESGNGTSRNSRLLHNFFGIKGKNDLLKTKGIRSSYKKYSSDTASFVDFCKLVERKKFYSALAGNPDYRFWLLALSKTGYSEVPETWRRLITGAIKKNGLDKTGQSKSSQLPSKSSNGNQ
ncbi:MAG: muramidase [Bacteroidetes bacterium]|nr:muramidase [Bacteroidota bacterium]